LRRSARRRICGLAITLQIEMIFAERISVFSVVAA
jgi:hypothetical protein